jgi:hypothetical protein
LHPLLREAADKFGVQRIDEAGLATVGYPGSLTTHHHEAKAVLDFLYADQE